MLRLFGGRKDRNAASRLSRQILRGEDWEKLIAIEGGDIPVEIAFRIEP